MPEPDLRPARELAALRKPFPNEPAGYGAARERLLAEEIELRRQLEKVARMRRELPPGGEPPPYTFRDEQGREVKLADLFGRHDTLVTYFWMYGPQRARPCPMCTSFLGSLDIPAVDIGQHAALAVIGRSPVERQLAFARERGWRHLEFYATTSDDFPRDYRGLDTDGNEWAALMVWVKRDGKIRLFWAEEMSGEMADPGQDPRGVAGLAPLWNLLDLTPAGRPADWYPKLEYPAG